MSGPNKHCAVLHIELCSNQFHPSASVDNSRQAGPDFIAASTATVSRLKGSPLKSGPTSLAALFTLADAAFSAATKILNTALRQGLRAKAGLHYGTASDDHNRAHDDISSKAVQICDIAGPGELLLTGATLPYLCGHFRDQCVRLQGNSGENQAAGNVLYTCKKQVGEQTVLGGDTHFNETANEPKYLFLTQCDREFFVTPEFGQLVIGRAVDSHIVLQGDRCSRNHAIIETGRDNYALVDQSTNGTCVEIQHNEVLTLHRKSTKLFGSGRLLFGSRDPENIQDIISYQVSNGDPD